MMGRTNVFITADIEFSAGGYWDDSVLNKPVGEHHVYLDIDGKSQGLGFILETLEQSGVTATFFVETAQAYYFGDGPMGEIARHIAGAGQDVQMHIHPMWISFAHGCDSEHRAPCDSLTDFDEGELIRILKGGLAVFDRWGVPRPVVIRAGNLQVSRAVYRAMHRLGVTTGSNLGCAIHLPEDPSLHLYSGRHGIEGVVEMPILSFTDLRVGGWRHLRNLTITGCSFSETRALLEKAHIMNLQDVVILTHAHEFVKKRDLRYEDIAPNRVNQKRLYDLCQFLADNRDRFATPPMGGAARNLPDTPGAENHLLEVGGWSAVNRIVVNKFNDTFWRF